MSVCVCVPLEGSRASSRVGGADRWPQGHSSHWCAIPSGDTNTLLGNFLLFSLSARLAPNSPLPFFFFHCYLSLTLSLTPLCALLCSLTFFFLPSSIFLFFFFPSPPVSLRSHLSFPTVVHDFPGDRRGLLYYCHMTDGIPSGHLLYSTLEHQLLYNSWDKKTKS